MLCLDVLDEKMEKLCFRRMKEAPKIDSGEMTCFTSGAMVGRQAATTDTAAEMCAHTSFHTFMAVRNQLAEEKYSGIMGD